MTPKILASPFKYIQGAGELSRISDHISGFRGPFLFVMGTFAYQNLKGIIEKSFQGSGLTLVFEQFQGECTKKEIDRLREVFRNSHCTVVVGAGGGKALDTAKGVAYYEDVPVISIPTIASTDAPTSAISVTYTEDHVFDGNLLLPKNPAVVLVDSEIIAEAPVRFLVAGMGDALSTYFEAQANAASGHDNFAGGKGTNTSLALAKLCYDLLIRDGVKAKESALRQECSPELENIIETNIYLSGVGFESNGLACAHSIYNAMTVLPQCHHRYHGELVAFGTIVQMVLENRSEDELSEVFQFCTSVGLPVSFDGISDDLLSHDDVWKVAHVACSPENFMDSEPFDVTEQMVFDAIIKSDELGRQYLENIR